MERQGRDYRLTASCVCSPSDWRLAEKIGRTLDSIHHPVPTLNEKLGATMVQFFSRLPEAAIFERRNWLIHVDDQLFQLRAGKPGRHSPCKTRRIWLCAPNVKP